MCGICGVIRFKGDGPAISENRLMHMLETLVHRGPDDWGIHRGPGVGIGARRLSIIDVVGGHQPLSNEDGTVWAAQNGELYNHSLLRMELERDGHSLATRCDTEILPHLYERDGAAVPERLRGKFGIAIWDETKRSGVVARDRLGVKPLYYSIVGNDLVFASELKAILASGLVDRELNLRAISAYLTLGFVPGSLTPFEGVHKLAAGHKLVIEDGRVDVRQYWTYPQPQIVRPARSADEYAEALLGHLDDAVTLRLMSDVPLGAMLSGGIDSSLIVALMARAMSSPVKTFSVGFVEAGAANELADARRVAEFIGTDHHELALSFSDSAVDLVDLAWHLDEPLADLSALGFLALSQLASTEVKVALSGQGADELLGGYSRHRNAALAARWDALPRAVSSVGLAALRRLGPRRRKAAAILAAPTTVERILLMKSFISSDLRRELLTGPVTDYPDAARDAIADALSHEGHFLTAALEVDARLSLVDDMLHYFDRASMAHSLEVRVPFLDHRLVEFCATIPPQLKVHGSTTKYILKRAARGLIPDDIIDKRKVGFFYPALAAWFRAESGNVREFLLSADARTRPFFDTRAVSMLIDRQVERGGNAEPLLTVLMLELWLRSLDRTGERPAVPSPRTPVAAVGVAGR